MYLLGESLLSDWSEGTASYFCESLMFSDLVPELLACSSCSRGMDRHRWNPTCGSFSTSSGIWTKKSFVSQALFFKNFRRWPPTSPGTAKRRRRRKQPVCGLHKTITRAPKMIHSLRRGGCVILCFELHNLRDTETTSRWSLVYMKSLKIDPLITLWGVSL